jgi:hypothetical protein
MDDVSSMKLRLLRRLRDEKRTLDYFGSTQQRAILEMIADGLIKTKRNGERHLVITPAGRNVLRKAGATK